MKLLASRLVSRDAATALGCRQIRQRLGRCGFHRRIEILRTGWASVRCLILSCMKVKLIRQGSFGNLASAATVAASSFEMKLRDPGVLLDQMDLERWHDLRGISAECAEGRHTDGPTYVEPSSYSAVEMHNPAPSSSSSESQNMVSMCKDGNVMTGKIQRLGDFIDTDAVRV